MMFKEKNIFKSSTVRLTWYLKVFILFNSVERMKFNPKIKTKMILLLQIRKSFHWYYQVYCEGYRFLSNN